MRDGEFEFVDEDALDRVDDGVALFPARGNLVMTGYDVAWLVEANGERSGFALSRSSPSFPRIRLGDVNLPSATEWVGRDFRDGFPGLPSGSADLLNQGDRSESEIRSDFDRRETAIRDAFDAFKESEDKALLDEEENLNARVYRLRADIRDAKEKTRKALADERASLVEALAEVDARWRRTIAEREESADYTAKDRARDMEAWQDEVVATRNASTERDAQTEKSGSEEVSDAYRALEDCIDRLENARKRHDGRVAERRAKMDEDLAANDDALADALHAANYDIYGSEVNKLTRFLGGMGRYDAVAGRTYGDGYDGDRIMRAFYNASAGPFRKEYRSAHLANGRYLVGRYVYGVTDVAGGELVLAYRNNVSTYTPSDSSIHVRIGTRATAGRIRSVVALLEMTGSGTTHDDDAGETTLLKNVGRYSWVSFGKSAEPCADIVRALDAEDDRFDDEMAKENGRHADAVAEIDADCEDAVATAEKRRDEAYASAEGSYASTVRSINAAYVAACRALCERYNTTRVVDGENGDAILDALAQKDAERREDENRARSERDRVKGRALNDFNDAVSRAEADREREVAKEDERHGEKVGRIQNDHSTRAGTLTEKAEKRARQIEDGADAARNTAYDAAQSAYEAALAPAEAARSAAWEEYHAAGEPTDPDDPAWKAWQAALQTYYDAQWACEKARRNAHARALIAWYRALSTVETLDRDAREVWSATVDTGFGATSGGMWWTTDVPRVVALFVEYAIETAVDADYPDYEEIDAQAEADYLANTEPGWRPFVND